MPKTQAPKIPFTEAELRKLPPLPDGVQRLRYRDKGMPGLELRHTPGAMSFAFRRHGVELTIGKWPQMTCEQAREKARKLSPNPEALRAAKIQARKERTIAQSWEALLLNPMRRDGKAALRPGTVRSYKESWLYLQAWGSRKRCDIDCEDVKGLRDSITTKHGPSVACRVLALLSGLMGGLPRDEEGRRIGKPEVAPRVRFMDVEELRAFLRALDAEAPAWKVFWMCALLAPLRPGNIKNAKWADIHLPSPAAWTVDASNAKGRKLLHLPIAEPLAVVLRQWRERCKGQQYLFPAALAGGKPGNLGPIATWAHSWKRCLAYAEGFRLAEAMGYDWEWLLAEVDGLRLESWKTARARKPMERQGRPLFRLLNDLRAKGAKAGLDVEALTMDDLQPYDARKTAASMAAQAGASMALIGAALGHKDSRMAEKHYAHLADAPVRGLMDANAARLLGAAEFEGVKI